MRMSPETVEIFRPAVEAMQIALPSKAEFARLSKARQRHILDNLNRAREYAEIVVFLRMRKRERDTDDLRSFATRNEDDQALREYEQRRRARDEERRPPHV